MAAARSLDLKESLRNEALILERGVLGNRLPMALQPSGLGHRLDCILACDDGGFVYLPALN
jgi:hypothetical protein